MTRALTTSILLISLTAAAAEGQQQQNPVQRPSRYASRKQAAVGQTRPYVVSVAHTIDLGKLITRARKQSNVRIGVSGYAAAQNPVNITTGLVIDGDGHIVTRLPNVDPSDHDQAITVTTSDGRSLTARLVGVDCASGFSVLEAKSLAIAAPKFGRPAPLADGAPVNIVSVRVLAKTPSASNAIQFNQSLTLAQVQVKAGQALPPSPSRTRPTVAVESPRLLARTDSSVAESPDGQIIGMVRFAGFGRGQLYPVDYISDTVARRVIDKNDSVPSAWLGVQGSDGYQVSDTELARLGLKDRSGLFVQKVEANSPAALSGVMPNDVIVAMDGMPLKSPAEMSSILQWSAAGQKIKLSAMRDGKPTDVDVVLGAREYSLGQGQWNWTLSEQPEITETAAQKTAEMYRKLAELDAYKRNLFNGDQRRNAEDLADVEKEVTSLKQQLIAQQSLLSNNVDRPGIEASLQTGFAVRELTSQLAKYFGVVSGLLVTNVSRGSAAERAGLMAGDVVTAFDDKSNLTASQFSLALSSNQGTIKLSVTRNKRPAVIELTGARKEP